MICSEYSLSQPLFLKLAIPLPEKTNVIGFFWLLPEMVYTDPNIKVCLGSLFILLFIDDLS